MNNKTTQQNMVGLLPLKPIALRLLVATLIFFAVLFCIYLRHLYNIHYQRHSEEALILQRTETYTDVIKVHVGEWAEIITDPRVESLEVNCTDRNVYYYAAINGNMEPDSLLLEKVKAGDIPSGVHKMDITLAPNQGVDEASFLITRYPPPNGKIDEIPRGTRRMYVTARYP